MADSETRELRLEPEAATTTSTAVDRAVAAGYPPDHGPEIRVRLARPSLIRGRPFSSFGLAVAPIVVVALMKIFTEATWKTIGLTLLVLAALCWFSLFVMWVRFTLARSLEVTNKRSIERNGLFSRSTNEVLHDHIRNITVKQSFFERLMGIGEIGIASSGQSGVEVDIRDIPDPDGIREIIDLYRPL